jgi:hypothetical protein
MQEQKIDDSGADVESEERIDATFRNGSVTAIGIMVGFSLGFLSQWASNPIAWSKLDLASALPIMVGIILQVKAFTNLLSIESLRLHNYERSRNVFVAGLSLVAAGIGVAIMIDILGLGPRTPVR